MGDAALLDVTGVLETAVSDSGENLLLKDHIPEAGRGDTDEGGVLGNGVVVVTFLLIVVLQVNNVKVRVVLGEVGSDIFLLFNHVCRVFGVL